MIYVNLILSDCSLAVSFKGWHYVDLSKLKIASCVGCFNCWVKTPGKCIIRDDAVNIYPKIAASNHIIYVTRLLYGGYDIPMKTMLERSLPIQQPFIRLLYKETHHVQRNVLLKDALIIVYGDYEKVEQEIFEKLVARNAYNMNFKEYRILFVSDNELEYVIQKEVEKWQK